MKKIYSHNIRIREYQNQATRCGLLSNILPEPLPTAQSFTCTCEAKPQLECAVTHSLNRLFDKILMSWCVNLPLLVHCLLLVPNIVRGFVFVPCFCALVLESKTSINKLKAPSAF